MSLEDLLPEDFEDREKVIGQFKDVPSLVNSYRELRKNMDSSVRVPTPESSHEERSAFFQRLGAPESADGYEIEEGTEEWATAAREAAHKAHLTKDQWATLTKVQKDLVANQGQALEDRLENSLVESKSRYGQEYDQVVEKAKTAMEALSSQNETLSEALGQVDLRDPSALELFSMVGDMMADGSAPSDGGTESGESNNDMDLAMRVRELMKMDAFSNRRAPEHEKVQVEYRQKLEQLVSRGYQGVFDPRLKNKPW